MGRKFPIDTKFQSLPVRESIYAPENAYGYRLNVSHPKILPLYEAYHRRIGVPLHIHLTHEHRLHFEQAVFNMMKRRNDHVQQSDPDGTAHP